MKNKGKMKIGDKLSLGFFICFNLFMIGLFIRGYFFPVESNFWLVNYGIHILALEIFILITSLIVYSIKLEKNENKSINLKRKERIKQIIILVIMIFLSSAYFIIIHKYSLFLFLVLIVISKLIIISENNQKEYSTIYGIMIIAFLVSGFLGFLFSFIGSSFIPQHETLLNKVIETGLGNGDELFDNPSFIFALGFFYYISISFLKILNLKRIEFAGGKE